MNRPAATTPSETARQLVHMSMGALALLLRYLAWWQGVALAAGAVLFNIFLLPRVAPQLYRPGDQARRLHGIIFYPASVLLLLLAFPRRPDIVAAAWGILAAGDGIATLAGRAIGGPRWPWNREKTVSGSVAFALFGAAAGVLLAWWCRPAVSPPPSPIFVLVAPIVAALVAALVETMPVRLDDNLSVAATAGGVMALGSLVVLARLPDAAALAMSRLPSALALNALVASAGYFGRTVTIAGALTGALIGITIYACTGWQGLMLLL
jgi:dolichol kinase